MKIFPLLVLSQQALAWEVKVNSVGEELMWAAYEVPYSINTGDSQGLSEKDVIEAITLASDAWDGGGLVFKYEGKTRKQKADYSDKVFAIAFEENWQEDPGVLALTYTWSDPAGEIVHFDMIVNAENFDWALNGAEGKHDLQNALTHEFGHALGLDHSDTPEASMAPTASAGEIAKRDLDGDDYDGYLYLYPGNGLADGDSRFGKLGSGGSCSQAPKNLGMAGVLWGLLLLRRRQWDKWK